MQTVTSFITKRIMNAGGLNSGGPQLLIITGRKALHDRILSRLKRHWIKLKVRFIEWKFKKHGRAAFAGGQKRGDY